MLGLCALGGVKPPGTKKNSKAWSLWLTWVCGGRLLALSNKRFLWGNRSVRFESSGVHKAAVVLGSTCIKEWVSRSYSSCCRCGGPTSSGRMRPEACLLELGYPEPQQLLEAWGNQAFG
jgi:hypothetical protein